MRVIFGKMKHFFGELHAASITLLPVWRALSNEGVASLKEPLQEQRLRIPYIIIIIIISFVLPP